MPPAADVAAAVRRTWHDHGRWILVVAVAALLVRLSLLTANGSITGGDGPVYFRVAHSLLDGRWLEGNDFRTPGYPVAMLPALLADRVAGRGEAEILLAGQEVLGFILAVSMLLVGIRYFSLWVGVAAGLLAALSPALLVLERLTYPDLLFACGLFAGAALLAEGAIRDGDRRWLVASGVMFGLTAYVKPAAQPLLVAPFLVLLISTRSLRPALAGGLVAGLAMLLTMAPWMIRNAAVEGTLSMSNQGGLTIFYRAFDDDRLPVPTDVAYGPLVRALQLQTPPSASGERLWQKAQRALRGTRGLSQDEAFDAMGRLARTAIRRHPGKYTVRSADDVRRTVGDIGATSTGPGFDNYGYLHEQLRAARVSVPPTSVAWAVVQVGIGLGVAWLVVTLYGLTALVLPFAGDTRVRAAGSAFLVPWLIVAVTTSLGHGSLWRYSAGLAPLAWMAGSAGAWVLWSGVATRIGAARSSPGRRARAA